MLKASNLQYFLAIYRTFSIHISQNDQNTLPFHQNFSHIQLHFEVHHHHYALQSSHLSTLTLNPVESPCGKTSNIPSLKQYSASHP